MKKKDFLCLLLGRDVDGDLQTSRREESDEEGERRRRGCCFKGEEDLQFLNKPERKKKKYDENEIDFDGVA